MSGEPRGVVAVVSDALSQAADLIQLEFRLARAELAEKALELKAGLALIVAGVILMTATLFLLLQTAVVVLIELGLPAVAATLIVAAGCALGAILLIVAGRKHFEPETLTPQRTMNEITRDGALVKEKLS